jgi:hypothetical protein
MAHAFQEFDFSPVRKNLNHKGCVHLIGTGMSVFSKTIFAVGRRVSGKDFLIPVIKIYTPGAVPDRRNWVYSESYRIP